MDLAFDFSGVFINLGSIIKRFCFKLLSIPIGFVMGLPDSFKLFVGISSFVVGLVFLLQLRKLFIQDIHRVIP